MRGRTAVVSLAAVALALAGCGSTKGTTNGSTSSATGPPKPPIKPAVYSAHLKGSFVLGVPGASAYATIAVAPPSELCWTFSELKGFTKPIGAAIDGHLKIGQTHTPLDGKYKASACYLEPPALLRLINAHPGSFTVGILTKERPTGAVLGPLKAAG